MKSSVYILISKKTKKFYVGFTRLRVLERLEQHNNLHYENSYTEKGIPWVIFHVIECESENQAIKIESHIKNMKSSKYIQNLKKFPEIVEKLKFKYI